MFSLTNSDTVVLHEVYFSPLKFALCFVSCICSYRLAIERHAKCQAYLSLSPRKVLLRGIGTRDRDFRVILMIHEARIR